jgi:hypothetical protein
VADLEPHRIECVVANCIGDEIEIIALVDGKQVIYRLSRNVAAALAGSIVETLAKRQT